MRYRNWDEFHYDMRAHLSHSLKHRRYEFVKAVIEFQRHNAVCRAMECAAMCMHIGTINGKQFEAISDWINSWISEARR